MFTKTIVSALAFSLCLAPAATHRLSSRAPATSSALPIVPLIVRYEHQRLHLTQWISNDPQYSMIQASFLTADAPSDVSLTETSSRRTVYYCTSPDRAKYLSASGQVARVAKIDYKVVRTPGQMPLHAFGLMDEHGQPVRWRFVPATDPSEQGAGLTPIGDAGALLLVYRDLGTAAGDGSAVQIGEKTIAADPWPEISAPPYFVAFRGSLAEGLGVGALAPAKESWRVGKLPAALEAGAEWELTNQNGAQRTLKVASVKGDELTIEVSGAEGASNRIVLVDRKTATGLALTSVTVGKGRESMAISFKPELDFAGASNNSKSESNFQIDEDGKKRLVEGKVSVELRDGVSHLVWELQSPGWAKSHKLETALAMSPDGYQVTAEYH